MEQQNNNKDFFSKASDNLEEAKSGITLFIEKYINWLMLLLIFGALGFLTFYSLGLQDFYTDEFIANVLVLVVFSNIAMIMFSISSKKKEKIINKSYRSNVSSWSGLTSKIQNGYGEDFIEFCKDKTEAKRIEKRDKYIKKVPMSIKKFEEEITDLNEKDFENYTKQKDKYNNNLFTKKQVKLLKKAKGKIKVKNINPPIVLLGTQNKGSYDVGEKEVFSIEKKIQISKTIQTIIMSVISASLILLPTSAVGWALIGLYMFRVAFIFTSAILGHYSGIMAVEERNNLIKRNIFFLKIFTSKKDIKVENK